jgi:hypothetical protein
MITTSLKIETNQNKDQVINQTTEDIVVVQIDNLGFLSTH